jgi:hypothetical protein
MACIICPTSLHDTSDHTVTSPPTNLPCIQRDRFPASLTTITARRLLRMQLSMVLLPTIRTLGLETEPSLVLRELRCLLWTTPCFRKMGWVTENPSAFSLPQVYTDERTQWHTPMHTHPYTHITWTSDRASLLRERTSQDLVRVHCW